MNIDQIRKDTPGCSDKIFLDSAGSSLMPRTVLEKMYQYLKREELLGGYHVADNSTAEIERFYTEVSKLINCNPRNIAFAHDATDAYTKVLSSIDFQRNDIILTTDDDYASNHINFISLQKKFGIKVRRIKNLANGDLDLDDFERQIKVNKPKLVAVTHVPTNSGLIQNVEAIGKVCAAQEIIFLLDACQSVGQMPVDVQKIKCDYLSVTGRKFLRGPRGTGFLYVSDRMLTLGTKPLYIDGRGATWTAPGEYEMGDTAKRFELWESPYALMIGLTEAVRYANDIGIEEIFNYNQQLSSDLRKKLSEIDGVQLLDKGSQTANLVTMRKANKSLTQMKSLLDKHKVFYSINQKEWMLIDAEKKGVDWVLRLSPHYFNTIAELDRVVEIIQKI